MPGRLNPDHRQDQAAWPSPFYREVMSRTRDHTVPIMYLRRFADRRDPGGQLLAAPVADLGASFRVSPKNVAVQTDFYWGTDPDGVPHHEMEALLSRIETEATPAFIALLDSGRLPTDDAFPEQWPPRLQTRLGVSWWVAAQVLRTDRQRQRLLATMPSPTDPIHEPRVNRHLRYIVRMIAPLAQQIFSRPWGIGFTSLCLITSDTPVVILNGVDDTDQVAAAGFWDIYLPLDPHRMLFLPGFLHRENLPVMRDHKFNLPGGLAIPLNDAVREAAVRHVFFHPSHNPVDRFEDASRFMGSRLDTPSEFVMKYQPIPPPYGVERRWLDEHVGSDTDTREPRSEEDVLAAMERMMANLRTARRVYSADVADEPGQDD